MIQGFLEIVRPFQARGWAFNSNSPHEAMTVELMIGNALTAQGEADVFREDLRQAGYGDGRHGFVLNVDVRLPVEDSGTISVQARSETGEVVTLETMKTAVPAAKDHVGLLKLPDVGLRFQGETSDPCQHPVFILGSARSGTSVLAQVLAHNTRYSGYEEGHLLDILLPLRQAVDGHYEARGEEWVNRDTLIASVPQTYFEDALRHIMVLFARQRFPSGWWLDKTPRPTAILAAPLLREIWPEARFIFMKRRGIENIISRLRKFPNVSFEEHCRDWSTAMRNWTIARHDLAGSCIELDQLHLVQHAREVAEELGPFLLLQSSEVTSLAKAFQFERPERTSEQLTRVTSLENTGWSALQQSFFIERCGEQMSAFGYGFGETYSAQG